MLTRWQESVGPGCDPWTLRFRSGEKEAGFLATRRKCLLVRLKVCGVITLLSGSIILCLNTFVLGLRKREKHSNDLGYEMALVQWWLNLAMLVVAGLINISLRIPKVMGLFRTATVEAHFSVFSSVFLVVACLHGQHMITKIRGYTLEEAGIHDNYYSDSSTLMLIVTTVTLSHMGLPIRWFSLLLLEIVSVALFAAIVLVIGSNEVGTNNMFNMLYVSVFVIISAMGKRAAERSERADFTNLISEKSLRCSAEFRLAQVDDQLQLQDQAGPPSQQDQGSSFPGSMPTTAPSGWIFDPIYTDCDLRAQLLHVAHLGDLEHWRIPSSDLHLALERPLGEGGFGVVQRGGFCGMMVAVKQPRQQLDEEDKQSLPELCNEVRVLRRLRHPNIVITHGAVVEPESSRIALVLELIHGNTLRQYMEGDAAVQAKEDPRRLQKFQILLGICRALLYMHTRNPTVIHGDLKDRNVMVEEAGGVATPKLLDFGLSRVLSRHTQRLGGTLAWMAPEAYLEQGPVRPSTDVYSFGRLMAYVATGIRPLADLTPAQIKRALKDKRLPPVRWLPNAALPSENCQAIVDQCVQAEPEQRPHMWNVLESLLSLPSELHLNGCEGFLSDLKALAHLAASSLANRSKPEAPRAGLAAPAGEEQEQASARGGRLPPLPEDAPLATDAAGPAVAPAQAQDTPLATDVAGAAVAPARAQDCRSSPAPDDPCPERGALDSGACGGHRAICGRTARSTAADPGLQSL